MLAIIVMNGIHKAYNIRLEESLNGNLSSVVKSLQKQWPLTHTAHKQK